MAELDDNDLLQLTRQGSTEAYAALYDRYAYGARRLARHLGQREESEDVVSDAFAQILGLLQRGKGPDRAFRAYLFTTIRHESGRRAKANKRVMPTDDDNQIDTAVPFGDGQLDGFERKAVRAAYESLPERWRTVLWHLDVEGRKPNQIAEVMGLKPNSVSALVYRARSGLREAYLQQHVNTTESSAKACADVRDLLAGVVRRTATMRDQEKVHAHLETCDDCIAVYLEIQEVNREVGAIVAPVALAAAVAGGGVLAATGSVGASVAHLFASAKGLLVASSVPAAAAAITTVSVMSGSVSTPAAAEPKPIVQTTPTKPAPAVTTAKTARPGASKKSTASATSPTKLPTSASAAPSTAPAAPVPSASSPALTVGPATVTSSPEALEVKVGSVTVSTKPVTDALEKVAPQTTGLVKQLVNGG